MEEEVEAVSMEYLLEQVTQKDLGKRLQVGQEVMELILDEERSRSWSRTRACWTGWWTAWPAPGSIPATSGEQSSSSWRVVLLGMDILSALVSRLQERFRTQVGTVLPSLIDRLGDAKDQVREQDQALLLKIMDQAANPQYVWERMMGGFKHKNNRTREGLCLCLISTLNVFGSQSLTLSKIVPHICSLLGDPTSQVRDGAMNCLVEIYRHVGERVRIDLGKKGLPQSRLNVIFSKFDEVQRSGNMVLSPLS
uniref:CLIP-associating protein 1-A n=1 Tax=Maylandia zebra TaxID=106582 RepID=UPI000D31094A